MRYVTSLRVKSGQKSSSAASNVGSTRSRITSPRTRHGGAIRRLCLQRTSAVAYLSARAFRLSTSSAVMGTIANPALATLRPFAADTGSSDAKESLNRSLLAAFFFDSSTGSTFVAAAAEALASAAANPNLSDRAAFLVSSPAELATRWRRSQRANAAFAGHFGDMDTVKSLSL